jgi:hypothetical protein
VPSPGLLCADGAARGDYSGLTALTFLLPELTIEVEMTAAMVQGQVVPACSGRIRLERCDGTAVDGRVDVDGWFRLGAPPPAGFRLEVDGPDGEPVRTPWVGRS